MNSTQLIITIGYSAAVIAVLLVSWHVIRSTRPENVRNVDVPELAHRESNWGLVVSLALVALVLATIFAVPYGNSTGGEKPQIVRVTGQQFAWVITPRVVEAGVPVEFRLTSKDVNHAFALYRGHTLEAQVQVMPKEEQLLVHTFDEPGIYKVECLEFCGLDHHLMSSTLEVR